MNAVVVNDGLPDGVLCIRLSAPRANALVPSLLADLHAALDEIDARAPQAVVFAAGRNFCSGGDIAGFHAAAQQGQLRPYAEALVPELQRLVLRLIEMPRVVALAARGAITGGGAGFLFASDLAVLSEDAFVQPYYNVVGFAPDGGWNAVLPERVGLARAQAWVAVNHRASAQELCACGLALDVVPADTVERVLSERLAATDLGTLAAAKSVFWDAERRRLVAQRLDAEASAFLERVAQPDRPAKLAAFLDALKAPHHV